MIEASLMRRLKAHRVLSLLMTLCALFGWGAYVSSAYSASVEREELRRTIVRGDRDRDNLQERHSTELSQAKVQIAQLEQKLVSTKAAKAHIAEPTGSKREKLQRTSRRPAAAPRQSFASLTSKTKTPTTVR